MNNILLYFSVFLSFFLISGVRFFFSFKNVLNGKNLFLQGVIIFWIYKNQSLTVCICKHNQLSGVHMRNNVESQAENIFW